MLDFSRLRGFGSIFRVISFVAATTGFICLGVAAHYAEGYADYNVYFDGDGPKFVCLPLGGVSGLRHR